MTLGIATFTTTLSKGWVARWLRPDRMFCGRVYSRGEIVDPDDWSSLNDHQRRLLVSNRFIAIVAENGTGDA